MKDKFGLEDVINRGLCIGCGVCAIRVPGKVFIELSSDGLFQARLSTDANSADIDAAGSVCPMSDMSENENSLAIQRFADLPEDPQIGRHALVLAGRLADDEELLTSSSGGLTSFVLAELLARGRIDGVVHVGRGDSNLFEYSISRSVLELQSKKKSNYYSTTLADVVPSLANDGLRYAVVGIPCFIRGMRNLAAESPEYRNQFPYFIGLLCGHLKSQFFAESLAWQLGVPPDRVESIDFRVKDIGAPSHQYDYSVVASDDSIQRSQKVSATVDGNWGYAAFQPEGCNFCDDVFAETADVVFGDAWLPEYTNDWRGTNVVVARHPEISQILREGVASGAVTGEQISAAKAAETQAGNFRHRWDGLRVRLADDLAAGLKVPVKRVAPGVGHLSRRRVALVRKRRRLSQASFAAFREAKSSGRLRAYVVPMRRQVLHYDFLAALDRGPRGIVRFLARRLVKKFRR